jgi:hypothetical protein
LRSSFYLFVFGGVAGVIPRSGGSVKAAGFEAWGRLPPLLPMWSYDNILGGGSMIHENQSPFAFISYQTFDKSIAGRIKEILAEFDIGAFLAHEDLEVSAEWRNEILENLKKTSLFICILSKNYLQSSFCMQESGIAVISDMTIIPFSLDETTSPGFSSIYQSKRVTYERLTIRDIIPGLVKWDKNEGIRIIIELIGNSGSFRNAELNFQYILPFIDDLNENQAERLFDLIDYNGQVKGAHLCLSDYIPRVLRKHGDVLTKGKYLKMKKLCEEHGGVI